ncbi:MAG TPA: EF-hand domain-containing protein [Methylocystis sp.]|nr:EF-hand domain-containing protein [Methylocystis sp.]
MWRASKAAIVSALALGVAASSAAYAASRRTWNVGERHVDELLQLMDADKNGRVSKEEFMSFMSAEFDRLDRDKNRELTRAELTRLPYYGGREHVNPHK